MINACMQQPLRFMFSFTTLIQLEHISKSQPAWPQRIMGHNTSLSIHSNNHCHGGEDRGFESPSHSRRCNWLRLHPDHRASLWRIVCVIIVSDDCFSDLGHFKCLQKDLWFLPKRHYCVSQAPGLCHPMSAHFPFWRICGGAQKTPDLPQAQTQRSIRLTHVEVLRVIFKKCSIVSCKCKKLFYSLCFEHSGKHWMV